jgi:hypothetical protein
MQKNLILIYDVKNNMQLLRTRSCLRISESILRIILQTTQEKRMRYACASGKSTYDF